MHHRSLAEFLASRVLSRATLEFACYAGLKHGECTHVGNAKVYITIALPISNFEMAAACMLELMPALDEIAMLVYVSYHKGIGIKTNVHAN